MGIMKTWRVFLIGAASLFGFSIISSSTLQAATRPGSPLTAGRATPPRGEIVLDGTVQSVTATRRLILTVTSVTEANGRTYRLNPPRTKQLILGWTVHPHIRDNPAARVDLNDIVAGARARVLATDLGPGKDAPARDVSVWTNQSGHRYLYVKPIG